MKRIILLLILSFSVIYNYAQTKEECIKYIKTRIKASKWKTFKFQQKNTLEKFLFYNLRVIK